MTVIKHEVFEFVCNGCARLSEWQTERSIPEGWELVWFPPDEEKNFRHPGHLCPECLNKIKEEPKKK